MQICNLGMATEVDLMIAVINGTEFALEATVMKEGDNLFTAYSVVIDGDPAWYDNPCEDNLVPAIDEFIETIYKENNDDFKITVNVKAKELLEKLLIRKQNGRALTKLVSEVNEFVKNEFPVLNNGAICAVE